MLYALAAHLDVVNVVASRSIQRVVQPRLRLNKVGPEEPGPGFDVERLVMQGEAKCLPRLLRSMRSQVMLAKIGIIHGPVIREGFAFRRPGLAGGGMFVEKSPPAVQCAQ